MRKEVLFSVIIGFGLGLIITFGVYTARKTIKEQSIIVSPVGNPTAQATPIPTAQSLSIVSPIDQSISKEAKVAISGVTSPSSWIIVMGEKGEKVIKADGKGNFDTEINLISGENEIQIKSVSDNGDEATKMITVVYSTVEI